METKSLHNIDNKWCQRWQRGLNCFDFVNKLKNYDNTQSAGEQRQLCGHIKLNKSNSWRTRTDSQNTQDSCNAQRNIKQATRRFRTLRPPRQWCNTFRRPLRTPRRRKCAITISRVLCPVSRVPFPVSWVRYSGSCERRLLPLILKPCSHSHPCACAYPAAVAGGTAIKCHYK